MEQPLFDDSAHRASEGSSHHGRIFTVQRAAQGAQATKLTESLDYHLVQNAVHARRPLLSTWFTQRSFIGIKPHTLLKLCVTMAIGLTVGILAVGLAIATENLINFKNRTTRSIIHDGHAFGVVRAACFHMAFSSALVLMGSALVQFWAPASGGSGVSLVIAYLNGTAVPRLLNHRNLITKWVGTVCGVAANLALGPEAPMVHLGACVAHCYTHIACIMFEKWQAAQDWAFCCLRWKRRKIEEGDKEALVSIFHNDAERREFICAGAAAGIAAAFGAPIGGVLFSMEEASTHWSRKVAWRCFLCTTVSVFTLAQLHPRWKNGVLSFKGVAELSNEEWFSQLPMIFVVSVGGGLLGVLFNAMHERLFAWRAARQNHRDRLMEVAMVACVTVGTMFLLAYWVGTCVDVPQWHDKGYGFTFYCTGGKYNDLATAFLANPDDTVKHIFSLGSLSPKAEVCHGDDCYFTLRSLIILCPSYLVFMTLSGGIAIPGGLFMPSILVGGSFGATCGLLLMKLLPTWNIQPGVYAMCAATAMLGGVFRASISLVVLLVEGTQSTKFMLGIIIAVICSNWVGDWILSEGVYETDLEADGSVVFLRPSPPQTLMLKQVREFMAWPVWCFREVESVAYVRHVLTETSHNGFPVVRATAGEGPHPLPMPGGDDGNGRGGPLRGLILRSQLLVLLQELVFCDAQGQPLDPLMAQEKERREAQLDRKMRLFYRNSYTHRREGVLGAHLENGHAVEEAQAPTQGIAEEAEDIAIAAKDPESLEAGSLFLDLRPFMDLSAPSVRPDTPGDIAHKIFLTLGLRHLPVLDEHSRVRGMITRRDLDFAAGSGAWRRNKQVPQTFVRGSLARFPSASAIARNMWAGLTGGSITPSSRSPSAYAPLLGHEVDAEAKDSRLPVRQSSGINLQSEPSGTLSEGGSTAPLSNGLPPRSPLASAGSGNLRRL